MDRIGKLREKTMKIIPYLSMERAKIVTNTYKEHFGKVSAPMIRALSFEQLMISKKIKIDELELIVGEKGEAEKSTPTFPELCCHTREDFEILRSRAKIPFQVSDEDIAFHENEVVPFFKGRSIRDQIFNSMTQEWKNLYDSGVFTEFMEQRSPGHTVMDGKIYEKGMEDFISKIEGEISKLDFSNDPSSHGRFEQLKAMKVCCQALIEHAQRYSRLAMEMAEEEVNEERKLELLELSAICAQVPRYKPRTFHEALQMYWFVHLGVTVESNTWDAFSPGRLDQHLISFYEQDIANNVLTREKAKTLLKSFWIKFNNQPAPPKVGVTMAESSTYTDFANISIGGTNFKGGDGLNEVSFLLLEVVKEMRILQPSTNIQLSEKNSDDLLYSALDIIKTGFGQPSIFNVEGITKQMLSDGKRIEDVWEGGTSGCVETGAFGKESYILTGYFNLPKVLEITLFDGTDPISGKEIGIKGLDLSSFESLLEAFSIQLKRFVDIKIRGNHTIEKLYSDNMKAPFLSVLIDDCIGKGLDYNSGGARYNTSYIQGVGIGSITDSLSSIKKHVFEDKVIDLDTLKDVLSKNYEGSELLHKRILSNTPFYGNDDDFADNIMQRVFDLFHKSVDGRPNYKGGKYKINMLPTTCHVYFGSKMIASPDGRKAYTPLSEGISPVQGHDKNGPSSVIRSAAKMPQEKTGGTLLNLRFLPDFFQGDKSARSLIALIRNYFRSGGHHIQFNVVDSITLEKAKANPQDYSDLIVRVAGYSDYFCDLSETLQNEIIDRTAYDKF